MPEAPIILIDARGLPCPQPVLRLRQGMRAVPPGTRLRLLASDPMASVDVRAFCLRGGHTLLAETTVLDCACFEIEAGQLRPRHAGHRESAR